MSGSLIVVLFLFLLTTGLPIAVSMGIPSALYLILSHIPPSQLIQRMVTSLNSFPLLAVPLFILAAGLMNSSGITERLFEFAKLLVGRMKGGLAQVNVVASLIFSGIFLGAIACGKAKAHCNDRSHHRAFEYWFHGSPLLDNLFWRGEGDPCGPPSM